MATIAKEGTYMSWGGLMAKGPSLSPPDISALQIPAGHWLAYGNGRSYGDSCFPHQGTVVDMRGLNRILTFDRETGVLRAEAGLLIGDLIRHTAETGWFPPVVPGTQHVTLGGALANDIHGKNHHGQGCFGNGVRAFALLRSDGSQYICTAHQNEDLFRATIGGMGLTGVVVWVELQLIKIDSTDILQEAIALENLGDFFAKSASENSDDQPYSVAWIDSLARGRALGRGILLKGRHADKSTSDATPALPARSRVNVPFTPPLSLINDWSLRSFNALYRWRTLAKKGEQRCSAASFFFPLDQVGHWNRLYGPRGLRQHQCVIPLEKAEATIAAMLEATHAAGQGSFLTVLKLFGSVSSPGLMSFPRPGATLTLDFPYRGLETDTLLATLDKMVLKAGGRINPYKDARMSADTFALSFPQMQAFRAQMDPMARSSFAVRVGLIRPDPDRKAA